MIFPSPSIFPRKRLSHTESSNLLSVLDQLHPNTLSNGRVWLLCLYTNLLKNNALGVRRTSEWRGFESGTQSALLVGQIGPSLLATVVLKFAGGVETTRLSFTHDCCGRRIRISFSLFSFEFVTPEGIGYIPVYGDNGN
ncbi:hypothetical protein ACMFMG_012181 [Clarireedia jacksonii]